VYKCHDHVVKCINHEGNNSLLSYQFLRLFWYLFQAKFFKIGQVCSLNVTAKSHITTGTTVVQQLVYCLSSKCRRRLLFPSWLMHLTTWPWHLYTGLPEIYLDFVLKKNVKSYAILSSKKLHEDIKINSNNSTVKGENFMKIG
jgi:hypothetical protein